MLSEDLEPAILLRRYKRYLADVELAGVQTVVHCPNPGAMTGLAEPGTKVWLRKSGNPKRALPYTWVLTQLPGTLVTVDTLFANKFVGLALAQGKLPELADYRTVSREQKYGDSRFDFRLDADNAGCYLEVKSTTLADGQVAMFPDACTQRGRKHLECLIDARQAGFAAVQFFCAVRSDVSVFRPADHIDRKYGETLRRAQASGVRLAAWSVVTQLQGATVSWSLGSPLPIVLE